MDGMGRYSDKNVRGKAVADGEVRRGLLEGLRRRQAGQDLARGLRVHFYNNQRPDQAQGYRTPAEVFSGEPVQSDEQSTEKRW